ncbi:MAG: hypothetical protein KKF48_04925 [Nanoarchaeota archaeon]|nr:hypothetical protein [Nanoarchaeota archaeon]MBU1028360.1 hypothetical protein [Nanoarchaeota archaeon]
MKKYDSNKPNIKIKYNGDNYVALPIREKANLFLLVIQSRKKFKSRLEKDSCGSVN